MLTFFLFYFSTSYAVNTVVVIRLCATQSIQKHDDDDDDDDTTGTSSYKRRASDVGFCMILLSVPFVSL